jgi:hypothetical protein
LSTFSVFIFTPPAYFINIFELEVEVEVEVEVGVANGSGRDVDTFENGLS